MKSFTDTYDLPLFVAMIRFAGSRDTADAPAMTDPTPFVDDAIDEASKHALDGHEAWVLELTADGRWAELHRFDPAEYDPSMMMEAAE